MSAAVEHRTHVPFGDGFIQFGGFNVMGFNQFVDAALAHHSEIDLCHLAHLLFDGHLSDERFNVDRSGRHRQRFFRCFLRVAAQCQKERKDEYGLLHTNEKSSLSGCLLNEKPSPK